ncbi:hypothetical protein BDK92_7283 [Micromonospora pisi]|uniref:Uncharacterized protein n=1 Tax=Micromonospora pisi TaxID=589240 RepID=A0A495JVE4_9ACTN|nr:DUF6221 family protein [Micromonospora pisi]RKR92801.1 hypothetical protein BDK92_7283 [Micromonospora pisi]
MTEPRIVWLLAQVDKDERVARRILRHHRESYAGNDPEDWVAERVVNNESPPHIDYHRVRTDRPPYTAQHVVRTEDFAEFDAEHIARFASPKRVLAEVDARRKRISLALAMLEGPPEVSDGPEARMAYKIDAMRAEALLKLDARPYAGRAGYAEHWGQP